MNFTIDEVLYYAKSIQELSSGLDSTSKTTLQTMLDFYLPLMVPPLNDVEFELSLVPSFPFASVIYSDELEKGISNWPSVATAKVTVESVYKAYACSSDYDCSSNHACITISGESAVNAFLKNHTHRHPAYFLLDDNRIMFPFCDIKRESEQRNSFLGSLSFERSILSTFAMIRKEIGV